MFVLMRFYVTLSLSLLRYCDDKVAVKNDELVALLVQTVQVTYYPPCSH